MRLIDADLVIDTVNEFKGKNRKTDLGIKLVEEIVSNAPTVDAERHGHWIPYEYGDYHWHKCSVCGVADKYIETVHRDGYIDKDMESIRHYCPSCGAKNS